MVEQFVDMICHFGFDAKFLKPLQVTVKRIASFLCEEKWLGRTVFGGSAVLLSHMCGWNVSSPFYNQALMVVDGKPISRNQIMVFHALLRKRSQTMLLFLSPEGRARRYVVTENDILPACLLPPSSTALASH